MNEIGTSLAPPSNGFEEFSPTFSSETKTQPTIALNGHIQPDGPAFEAGRLSKLLRMRKQAERHERDKDHHQKNSDRIIVARIRIALDPLQRALHAQKIIDRAHQERQPEFADEFLVVEIADGITLPAEQESLLVAAMRQDLLQLGIRQIVRQFVLERRLAFRRRKFGDEPLRCPPRTCFPTAFARAEKSAGRSAMRNGDRTCP